MWADLFVRMPYTRFCLPSGLEISCKNYYGTRRKNQSWPDLVPYLAHLCISLSPYRLKIYILLFFQLIERLEMRTKMNKNGGLELDYELDLDLEEFESLQLPEISHGRYLHDFKVNLSEQKCFLFKANSLLTLNMLIPFFKIY